MILVRGLGADLPIIDRWSVLIGPPVIEPRMGRFRRPQCGLMRTDETDNQVRNWRQYR